jgi:hypothetical protein
MKALTANQVIGFWYDGKSGARLNSRMVKEEGKVFDARTTRVVCSMRVESHKSENLEYGPVVERALKGLWGGTECFEKMSLAADFIDSLGASLLISPLYPAYMDEHYDPAVASPVEFTLSELCDELKIDHRQKVKRLLESHAGSLAGCNKCGGKWYIMPEALEFLRKVKKVVDIAA